MKSKNLIVLFFASFLMCGCCFFFPKECECEDIQSGAELADLLLQDFESVLVSNDESVVYNVLHTIINYTADVECPEEVSDANEHTDKLQLIYSEDEDFTNPIVVSSQNAAVNQSTVANDNYVVTSNIQFETAGFYIIDNSIDDLNDVDERSESNNNDINVLGTTSKSKIQIRKDFIIHVTEEMISNSNKTRLKTKYISRWDITVN